MAIIPSLQISFPTSLKSTQSLISPSQQQQQLQQQFTFITKAQEPDKESSSNPTSDENFVNRLAQVRLRYRSGIGKKAEQRKAKKSKKSGGSGSSVFLPPVPLKEPVSDGLKIEFGFSPYTERLNGRLAALGLVALILVELGSGKSLVSYHAPPILFIQIYTVAAVAALFIKYEKEKVSIWPESPK